jgi:hypothetical protein
MSMIAGLYEGARHADNRFFGHSTDWGRTVAARLRLSGGARRDGPLSPEEVLMPALAIFRADGDPDDLLLRYDKTLPTATATSPVRPDIHVCARTDTGIVIVDVWASREDLLRGVVQNDDFQAKWNEAGWPDEAVEVYEIHNQGWPAS